MANGAVVVVNPSDITSPSMTRQEAQDCVTEIKLSVQKSWQLILELHDRRGWEILGYKSWRECMVTEFDVKQAQAYNMLNAAKINKTIVESGSKPIPERHARALTPLAGKPSEIKRIHREVQEKTNGNATAADYQAAVSGEPRSGQPLASSPASVIDTLMRKISTLDTDSLSVTLMKAGRTPDDAVAVSRWFASLATAMESNA